MKKRLLSALLVALLLLTLLPATALAAPAEQFTGLTPGQTYWFDLSAVGITGTVNTALPDTTLHYVPFTYAGTVDAYVLNAASAGETGASAAADATTASSADFGYRYDHSLFVADNNVTTNVNWNDLNADGFIFGVPYSALGVRYSLRAPSVGSAITYTSETDFNSYRGVPASNEWDAVLDKGIDIINWDEGDSLGQDTDSTFPTYRRSRGTYAMRGIGSGYLMTTLGYRPVLEVTGALSADALRSVTLDLSGGSVGGSDTVSIVAQSGNTFLAPSASGLTRPAGNTLTYFSWLGSDGVIYAPGDVVPSTVTALTAQWVDGVVLGDFVVKGGEVIVDFSGIWSADSDYNYLAITGDAPLTITMRPGVERINGVISVQSGVCADITLAGVKLITDRNSPLTFENAGDSTLTLAPGTTNYLESLVDRPGVCTGTSTLTIDGGGTLTVHGGPASAGIGVSLTVPDGGDIVINGGAINAYGGAAIQAGFIDAGAGIGGSYGSAVGAITINGGVIYAEGGIAAEETKSAGGAGIGSGGYSDCGDITINGGVVTAVGATGPHGAGAGIGAGGGSSHIDSVTITGGVINATAGANGAAGIGGGGHDGLLGALSITGGFITAAGTYKGDNMPGNGNANAIGGGAGEQASDLSGVTGAVIIDAVAKTGSVYGSAVLTAAADIPAGVTLTVPEDASLTVGEDATLTNRGLIIATGTLARAGGVITGDGEIRYSVAWSLTDASHDKGEGVVYASNKDGFETTLSVPQGYALPTRVTVKVGGVPLTGGYTYDARLGTLQLNASAITGNVEITALGRIYCAITASAGAGGSISPLGAVSVPAGGNQTFTVTPETGYEIADVLVDGVSVKDKLSNGSYTFENVTADHTVAATFAVKSPATGDIFGLWQYMLLSGLTLCALLLLQRKRRAQR